MANENNILMEHNIDTCTEALECLEKHGRVAVIQPTGTGKSYIAMHIMREVGKCKKIVIAPSRDYLDTMAENKFWDKENTLTLTYSYIGRHVGELKKLIGEKLKAEDVGLIVIDELHRAGAEKWGEAVDELISIYKNAKILGLTATPIRTSDNGINMVDKLFNGISVGNMSLCDTIEMGILPKMRYITGVESIDKEIDKLEKLYARHRFILDKMSGIIGSIKEEWQAENTFKSTLKKYLAPEIHKGMESRHIVFMRKIEDVENYKSKIFEWFSDIYKGYNVEVYTIHSKNKRKDTTESIQNFSGELKENTIKVIITVQMLSESFHFDSVASISMFRYTEAANVFIQQIGRGLSANGTSPFIFDFVDNFDSVGNIALLAGNKERDASTGFVFEYFSNEVDDCMNAINKIKSKINSRIMFYNNMLPKYAEIYDSLYSIEDSELRRWAIQQYKTLNAAKDKIITENEEVFKLTKFISITKGEDWIHQYNNYDTLTDEEKREFIGKAIDMHICEILPKELCDKISKLLGRELDSYTEMKYLLQKIENNTGRECRSVSKLVNALEHGSLYERCYSIWKCRQLYTEEAMRIYSVNDIDRASAYKVWCKIQEDERYQQELSISLTEEEEVIHRALLKFKKSNRVSYEVDEFKLMNTGILLRDLEDNSDIIISMLDHFGIRSYNKLAEVIDKLYMFSDTIDYFSQLCKKSIYTPINDRHAIKKLDIKLREFMELGKQEWLCKYFRIKYESFCTEVLPLIALIIGDNTLYNLDTARGLLEKYKESEKKRDRVQLARDKTKTERHRIGVVTKNVSKDYNLDWETIEDLVSNYIAKVKEFVKGAYAEVDGILKIEREITKDVSNRLLFIYKIHDMAELGIAEYQGIYEITEDVDLLEKIDALALKKRLGNKVLKTASLMGSGYTLEQAAIQSGLRSKLTELDEDAIETILRADIEHKDSNFYHILYNIDTLPEERYIKKGDRDKKLA